jgi:hypothetical protein
MTASLSPDTFDATQTTLTVTCPSCHTVVDQERFEALNKYVVLIDRRPGAQKAYKGLKRRTKKLIKRAMRRADGVRRLSFYVDQDVDIDWLIRFFHARGLTSRDKILTRSVVLQLVQEHLTVHGSSLPVELDEISVQSRVQYMGLVTHLFPDMADDYGRKGR